MYINIFMVETKTIIQEHVFQKKVEEGAHETVHIHVRLTKYKYI